MERIGIAASHIAKGNLIFYNLFVVLIAFLFSLLVFVISGLIIIFGLILISFLTATPSILDLKQGVFSPIAVCFILLGLIISAFNLYAIGINIKIKRN